MLDETEQVVGNQILCDMTSHAKHERLDDIEYIESLSIRALVSSGATISCD